MTARDESESELKMVADEVAASLKDAGYAELCRLAEEQAEFPELLSHWRKIGGEEVLVYVAVGHWRRWVSVEATVSGEAGVQIAYFQMSEDGKVCEYAGSRIFVNIVAIGGLILLGWQLVRFVLWTAM